MTDIAQLLRSLLHARQPGINDHFGSNRLDMSSLVACLRSAATVASSASTYAGDRAGSSVQIDGSILGPELSDEQRQLVEDWIPEPFIPDQEAAPYISDDLSRDRGTPSFNSFDAQETIGSHEIVNTNTMIERARVCEGSHDRPNRRRK